jgi:alkylhydroperoxidase/carboxymuconolactone decarboxylase family protein YurZ
MDSEDRGRRRDDHASSGLHLRAAPNLGISKQEIKELIIHLSQYSGIPTSVEAICTFRQITEPKKA